MFRQEHLPTSRKDWAPIFLGTIGSPDPNGRQLDGMGGGISSLSKICVVGPSSHSNADVDYTFAAIGVKDNEVDYSANCGNMTSAIGPFAVDSGLVDIGSETAQHEVTVRIHNTNTGKLIDSTFTVEDGETIADGDFGIDGVSGSASKIRLSFLDPAGAKTGKLLPTGNVLDRFDDVNATCIDAGNPCVFVQASELGILGTILPDEIDAHPTLLGRLDSIRRQASVAMGISKVRDTTPGSIPKIALVSRPSSHKLSSGDQLAETDVDLVVRALSVGQPHRAVPVTVAMALAAAAGVNGSIVQLNMSSERVDPDGMTIGHSSGRLLVASHFDDNGNIRDVTLFRTARRLMEGRVFWK